jgi:predicted XRE-type DNA-binding protein
MGQEAFYLTASFQKENRLDTTARDSPSKAQFARLQREGQEAMTKEYKTELEYAKGLLADARARGNDALGTPWSELRQKLFTPEELAASDVRVEIMAALANIRHEKGLSQRKLGELAGVAQPVIARMERGTNSPGLDNVLRVLAPLGKTLRVVDIADATHG